MSYGTLDVITLSGYGQGGRKMKAHQRRFKAAAKRCHGDAACMSRALSGYGKMSRRRRKSGRKRRGMGILPHRDVAGTECIRTRQVYSPFYGRKVTRCAEYGYNPEFRQTASYQDLVGGKKVGPPSARYKKGMWKSAYKKKKRPWPGGGTADMDCKAYRAKGRKCAVRCAWYGGAGTKKPKGTYKTADRAKAACKKSKKR